MVSTIRLLIVIAAVVGGLHGVLRAQQPDPFFAQTEFAQWPAKVKWNRFPGNYNSYPVA